MAKFKWIICIIALLIIAIVLLIYFTIYQPATSLASATSEIKAIYRERFDKFNPFYFDLGFHFDMNSWIPIKLVAKNDGYVREEDDDEGEDDDERKEDDDHDEKKENDPFQLIANGLKRNANELEVGSLVVITGK